MVDSNQEKVDVEIGCEKCCPRYKNSPRDEKAVRLLQNRLNRMIGQLNGIKNMVEGNRYCGDILTQVAAVESALQSFGYLILHDHLETCVVEEIRKGNTQIVEEAVEFDEKIKIGYQEMGWKDANRKIPCDRHDLRRMQRACGKGGGRSAGVEEVTVSLLTNSMHVPLTGLPRRRKFAARLRRPVMGRSWKLCQGEGPKPYGRAGGVGGS